MPRPCTICQHPDRAAIDAGLVGGEPNRRIAARYAVTEQSVRRHRDGHIPATLADAQQAAEVADADALLAQVRDLQARALKILDRAEDAGDLRTALGAIREARGNLELLGRLAGELQDAPTVNLYLSAEWLELRTTIITALEPYQEAREAVLRALEGVGNG